MLATRPFETSKTLILSLRDALEIETSAAAGVARCAVDVMRLGSPARRYRVATVTRLANQSDKRLAAHMVRRTSIFVSYAHADEPLVRQLVSALRERTGEAVDYVLDEQLLAPGDSISGNIASRIFSSQGVLLVLPSRSQGSWPQAEMAIALAKAQNDPDFKLLPVVTGNSPVPQLIADRLYVDLRTPDKFNDGVDALAKAVLADRRDISPAVQQAAKEMTMQAQSQLLRAAKIEWAATKSTSQKSIGLAFISGIAAVLVSVLPLAAEVGHLSTVLEISFIVPAVTAIGGFALGWVFRSAKDGSAEAAERNSST